MATARIEVDHLAYVRKQLVATQPSGLTRIAADAGLSVRTLENVRKGERGAHYDTVMRLYRVLVKAEKKAKQ